MVDDIGELPPVVEQTISRLEALLAGAQKLQQTEAVQTAAAASPPAPAPTPAPTPVPASSSEVETLKKEFDELRRSVLRGTARTAAEAQRAADLRATPEETAAAYGNPPHELVPTS